MSPIVSLPGRRARIGAYQQKQSARDMVLPELMEDIVEEILLRVPPDDPAHLVCKAWHSIFSDSGFRRRYRRFHQTPPLLGYIRTVNLYSTPEFVPTTALSPPPPLAAGNPTTSLSPPPPLAAGNACRALDCRHGRVLIHNIAPPAAGFIVWDPITGNLEELSFPAHHDDIGLLSFVVAVLCARHGCDHLDCHGGPFLVVYGGGGGGGHWASVYSSETGVWSAQASSSTNTGGTNNWNLTLLKHSLLLGDAIYFTIARSRIIRILKYDLGRHALSMIDAPQQVFGKVVPIDVDGKLGLAESSRNRIYTWSRRAGGIGVGGWVRRDVDLETFIPPRCCLVYKDQSPDVIRFVEGTDTLLMISLNNNIDRVVFTLNLKSRQVRKVANRWSYDVLPYTSFYTPDLAKGKQSLP